MKKKEQLQGDFKLYQKYTEEYDKKKAEYHIMFDEDMVNHVKNTFTEEEVDLIENTFKILADRVSFMDIVMNVFIGIISITMLVVIMKSGTPLYFAGLLLVPILLIIVVTLVDIKRYKAYKKLMKNIGGK